MNPVLKKATALYKVAILPILRPRKRLWTELGDIGLVGGCYSLLFFTTGDHMLSTLIALLFSPPSLTQETVARLLNLMVATFPLALGTALVTTAYIGKLQFIRRIQLAWNPLMGIVFMAMTLWIFTWIGTLLGIGGISSTALNQLIAGPLSYCYRHHAELCVLRSKRPLCSSQMEKQALKAQIARRKRESSDRSKQEMPLC